MFFLSHYKKVRHHMRCFTFPKCIMPETAHPVQVREDLFLFLLHFESAIPLFYTCFTTSVCLGQKHNPCYSKQWMCDTCQNPFPLISVKYDGNWVKLDKTYAMNTKNALMLQSGLELMIWGTGARKAWTCLWQIEIWDRSWWERCKHTVADAMKSIKLWWWALQHENCIFQRCGKNTKSMCW